MDDAMLMMLDSQSMGIFFFSSVCDFVKIHHNPSIIFLVLVN